MDRRGELLHERRSGAHFCVARAPAITFAVVGHNEGSTLARALHDARVAARGVDRVRFINSSSTDGSARVAEALGVPVVDAPLGKGRALARALLTIDTPYVCLIDADILDATQNIPAKIAATLRSNRADMVIGDFDDEPGTVNAVSDGVYRALVTRLFPEAAFRCGRHPLSGFRALRADWARENLPPDFGVEAHLNITFAIRPGARLQTVAVGRYEGPFRYKPTMGLEVGRTILDLAQEHGRLVGAAREKWDGWLGAMVDYIATYRGERSRRAAFAVGLERLTSCPFPAGPDDGPGVSPRLAGAARRVGRPNAG